jgi:GcrA cell cycle regulator
MGSPKWKDDSDKQLKELLRQGLTYDQIASVMKRSRGSVIGRASRLELKSAQADRYNPSHKVRKPRAPAPVPPAERPPEPVQAAPEPVPEVVPPVPTAPTGITIDKLLSTHCRWPLGDPARPDFSFCGEPKQPHRSYCDHHHKISYTPPVRRPFKKGVRT